MIKVFNDGEKTGRKASPPFIEEQMSKHFKIEDRKTAKQIRSYFSRLSAANKKKNKFWIKNLEII